MQRFKTLKGTLARVINESTRVKRFFIQLKERSDFVFLPGQNLVLSIPGFVDEKNRVVKRVFSIASCPDDELIELCIAINPTPSFSSNLASLAVESALIVEGPFGQFILSKPTTKVTLIAAGTGIAPLICMIRSLFKQGFSGSIELFFGFQTPEDFLYRTELEEYSTNKSVRLVACASRDGGWTGLKGRITKFLPSMLTNTGQDVYVCGPPEMVKDTLLVLNQLGFSDEQIKKEQW